MTNKRRAIIIFLSVGLGSVISFWMVKKRMGNLSQDNINQLIFNFIFAIAIVVGIALLFKNMNDKDKKNQK